MKKERSYGAVVLNDKNEFLLIRHRFGGHWDFPKGHKEKGETDRETALREVFEETGLTLEIGEEQIFQSAYSPKEGVDKVVEFFVGRGVGDVVVQEKEITDFGYFTYEEALEKITYDTSKEVLKQVKAYLDSDILPSGEK
jgi:tRNA nucleotidyltransferase (CCA-adding enzyme)